MAPRAQRLDALAALKAARSGGVRVHHSTRDEDAIYDEVSEQAYQSIVRGRMMDDDFIEDDDGSGYVDHGQDEWETREESLSSESEDEGDYFARTGRRKPKKGSRQARRAMAGQTDYLGNARRIRAEADVRREVHAPRTVSKEAEADFMSSLMGGLNQITTPARPHLSVVREECHDSPSVLLARKRKQMRAPLPALQDAGSSSTEPSSDPPEFHSDASAHVHISGSDSPLWGAQDASPTLEPTASKRPKHEDEDFGTVRVGAKRNTNVVSARGTKADHTPTPPVLHKPKEETPNLTSWHAVHSGLANLASSPAALATPKDASDHLAVTPSIEYMQPDKSVHFFWFDHYEIQGTVHLFGKVYDPKTERYVSCTVSVGGIERCVFLQPRPKMLSNGHETDVVPDEDRVYDEFDTLRSKFGIQSWLGKWVTRKYAFELADVDPEGEYMKVKYGFDEPPLPIDVSGATFARAFGTNTSAFELFVVKRKIMGPCWLRIENASVHKGAAHSWSKLELSVDDPKDVAPFADGDASAPKEMPPLTIMSLSTRSVVNYKENKREIVALSTRVWRDMSLENPTPPGEIASSSFTAVRPLGPSFPTRFEEQAKKSHVKIQPMKYERLILSSFLAQVQLNDPDVILSYDFSGSNLDILLHRMRDLKLDQWSKLGRLRRSKWPMLKQGMNTSLLAGRLVCDLSSDTAKGMISSTTWSLSEMTRTHLGVQREDIDPDDIASYFDCTALTPDRLLDFVRHCEVDAYFQMAIATKVQLLALTKQLTNLAGNSWARTLNGGRAERNEYILLHEFHRKKYICPDKIAAWEKKALKTSKASKKEKFKGGLVFEPKRGLWDKYILVMDFNSLYPSIIQEFNIDFTTVERSASDEADAIPPVPSSDVSQGVLPHLIATLVNRRRQVKSLMKDKNAPALKQLQWNIKQQALKLTANSMYGCLGFENSRFYARPLAALTTFKGREILTTTRELAESMALDVIYGDTDSVMINTNCVDYNEALRIGNEFKRAVNEKYRLLEIDIDGVFQRMLLLQKKKYAALLVDAAGETTTEIKGLDMKRREYCQLSKDVSGYVIEQILSGEATEVVVEKIHEYLQQVGADVLHGKIPLEAFVIYKRLGKRPQDYPDAQNQPHVQVALRMLAKNESARSGDVIPYVFCLGAQDAKRTQAEHAFHPDDVRRNQGDKAYQVDYKHYLSLQIMPPIERLCDSIQGTDRSRLAQCLGLDAAAYATSTTLDTHTSSREFTTLDSQVPSVVRYAKCAAFLVQCKCGAQNTFEGLAQLRPETDSMLSLEHGFCCTQCTAPLRLPWLATQLELAIRTYIEQYYSGWTCCTESTCRTRTNQTGVYSARCLVSSCRGRVVPLYSDKDLYTQLCYFDYLLDTERVLQEAGDAPYRAYIQATAAAHKESISVLHGLVQQYLSRNGRRYVGLGKLFSFMRV
ncbi:DNA-directed DNA polymerase [Malassezia vespertilionis]|uniref:DNA polymerase n=1 Tax=Malassezia vespertilionis TaxID=2020962 RepID=A0A2N1JC10_9BASI|nr:DNA-directed DNA polymerase [Malassezia vespertilionis]PKI84075.1 Pol1p [Malassezia vespertilionis]WFD07050.1 DNA-directed DNA polymerase [Malassezia vespertilionis]